MEGKGLSSLNRATVKFHDVPLTDLTDKCEVQTLSECQLPAANPPFYLISVNSIR